jgi:hypothetical protein
MDRKGRRVSDVPCGEAHVFAVLNAQQVQEIRLLAADNSFRQIAAVFGVTAENVSSIVHRRTWKSVLP